MYCQNKDGHLMSYNHSFQDIVGQPVCLESLKVSLKVPLSISSREFDLILPVQKLSLKVGNYPSHLAHSSTIY